MQNYEMQFSQYTASQTPKCIPRQKQPKKLRETNQIYTMQKVYLPQYGHFMNVKKIYLLLRVQSLPGNNFDKTFDIFDIFEKSNIDIFEISIFIDYIDIPQQPNLYAI